MIMSGELTTWGAGRLAQPKVQHTITVLTSTQYLHWNQIVSWITFTLELNYTGNMHAKGNKMGKPCKIKSKTMPF